MQQSSKISEYLTTICKQIRWKKAHSVISEEIENHIIDQKNAFIANGLDEEAATDRAIKEMGDPILVGAQLDRTHRPKTEWSIIVLTGIALSLGLAIRMIVTNDSYMPLMLTKSIINTVIGIGFMVIAYFLDFTIIGKHPKIIYFGLITITIGIMIISPIINGQYFYIKFILLLFPTAFAGIIYNMRSKGYSGVILCGVYFVVPAFIGVITPSFSCVYIYSITCLILLTVAIVNGWFNVKKLSALLLVYIPTFISSMLIFFITILNSPYGFQRLQVAIKPSLDLMGAGYIGTITRALISGAKFFGKGDLVLSSGIVLPNIETDFLLTYLIHQFGWITFVAIIAVILVFIIRSFMLCLRQKSVLGRLVSTSVLITFTMQVVLYITCNLGFILFSPLTLPLISYGGTATIINMLLIGVMLSVFKSGDLVHNKHTTSIKRKNKFIEIVDGKLIIDLK
ncbi:MAG: hypothetical protein K0R09_1301 [Clostridiales bacterium]|nr:hypothetical protein [Clostridiales bacterium]